MPLPSTSSSIKNAFFPYSSIDILIYLIDINMISAEHNQSSTPPTYSHPLILSLPLPLSLSLSLTLSHTFTHSSFHSFPHSHFHSHPLTHSLSLFLTLSLTLSPTYTLTHIHSLTLSPTPPTPTLTLCSSRSFYLFHSFPLRFSFRVPGVKVQCRLSIWYRHEDIKRVMLDAARVSRWIELSGTEHADERPPEMDTIIVGFGFCEDHLDFLLLVWFVFRHNSTHLSRKMNIFRMPKKVLYRS